MSPYVGGALEYGKQLPHYAVQAGTAAARGATKLIPSAAFAIAKTPYAMQRAWDIGKEHFMNADGGKYSTTQGQWNKWKASEQLAAPTGATGNRFGRYLQEIPKAYADTADQWSAGLNKGLDKIMPYAEDMPQYARNMGEWGGSTLAGIGIAQAASTSKALPQNAVTNSLDAFNRAPKTLADATNVGVNYALGRIPRVGEAMQNAWTAGRNIYGLGETAYSGMQQPIAMNNQTSAIQ